MEAKGKSKSSNLVYGLTTKARAMDTQWGEQDKMRFIIGTKSLREENEVHMIEVSEDEDDVRCINIFGHTGEVCALSASPGDPSQIFTCYTSLDDPNNPRIKATLWKLNEDDSKLEKVVDLKGHEGDIKNVIWNIKKQGKEILSFDKNYIRYAKLDSSDIKPLWSLSVVDLFKPYGAAWSPINDSLIATIDQGTVRGWDMRAAQKETFQFQAHAPIVRDIHFNPARDYHFATAGDDYKIKFWDLRKPTAPLLTFGNHNHWVWRVRFNTYYDQLVLSSGTDGILNLYNVVSISSKPLESENKRTGKFAEDSLIQSFEDHEDSIYAIAWATKGFTFASLSYDGRVVVNHVPKDYQDMDLY